MSSPTGRADDAQANPEPAREAPPSSRRPESIPPAPRAPMSSRGSMAAYTTRKLPPVTRHPLFFPIVALHAVAMFAWSLLRHLHYGSAALDLGGYHSVFWNLAFSGTPWNSVERAHQYSTHLEIGLAPIAILYRIAPTPVWLFAIQAVTVAATAIPIEALARRITRDRVVALLAATAMLLTPQLVHGDLTDLHSIVLCALPMAVIAWGIEVNSSRTIALAGLCALLIREQMGLFLIAAGAVWVIRQGRRRLIAGVLLAIAGASYFVVVSAWIIPLFGGTQSIHHVANYRTLGGSANEAIGVVGSRPGDVLALAFGPLRRSFLLELVSGAWPLFMLSLRSIRRSAWPLLLAVPQLASQLLSDNPTKWNIASQYGTPVVPLIAAAAVLSLVFIPEAKSLRRVAAIGWLALVVLHTYRHHPRLVGRGRPIDPDFGRTARANTIEHALKQIPPDASVSAQDNLVAHVASRPEVHLWPDGDRTDDYVLLDAGGISRNVRDRTMLIRSIARFRSDPAYKLVVDDAGVILAKRLEQ